MDRDAGSSGVYDLLDVRCGGVELSFSLPVLGSAPRVISRHKVAGSAKSFEYIGHSGVTVDFEVHMCSLDTKEAP
jgi:hypothetical protein